MSASAEDVAVAPEAQSRACTPIHGPGRPDKYLDARGEQVPSVTTITGRFKDSGALIAWAHKQGALGVPLNQARDKAADAGHVVHQWIQDWLAGRDRSEFPFTDDETLAKSGASFAAFMTWSQQVGLEVIATEIPLVHSRLGYGGTLDALGWITNAFGVRVLALLDWKSGDRTYPEHLVQQSAYRELLTDARAQVPEGEALPAPACAVLVRLDKATGKPHPREFDESALNLAWVCFSRELELYRLDQAIAKMVAEPKKKRGGKAA